MRFVLKPAVWYLDSYFLESCDVQNSHKLCYIWGTTSSYSTGQRLKVPSVPGYRGVILLHIYFKSQCSTEMGKSRARIKLSVWKEKSEAGSAQERLLGSIKE